MNSSVMDCDSTVVLDAFSRSEAAHNLREEAPARRCFDRHSVRGDAVLHSLDTPLGATALRIQLRDASLAGVGFLCSQALPVDSVWRVVFVVKGYTFGQQVISIRHCRRMSSGAYFIGAQFCIEPGMLCLLGVDAASVRTSSADSMAEQADFVPPADVE